MERQFLIIFIILYTLIGCQQASISQIVNEDISYKENLSNNVLNEKKSYLNIWEYIK